MKKILYVLSVLFFVSCNNADHKEHHDTEHSNQVMNDSNSASKSMYQLMQDNMHQMMMVKSAGVPDLDFAALMKIHHQGAVKMAQVQIAEGKDEAIKKISQQIINDQQKEIAILDSLMIAQKATGSDSSFFKKSMQDMHHMTLTEEKTNVDKEFLQMMIPHHEGAIIMARIYLQNGATNKVLQQIANNIIKTQQAEIDMFKKMLSEMKQ